MDRALSTMSPFLGKYVEFVSDTLFVLTLLLFLNHLVACVWVVIGRLDPSDTDTGATWLDLATSPIKGTYNEFDVQYQYTTALHWALTQMTPGSMQVFPTNSQERVYNVFILLFCMMVFSSLVSSLSA